MKSALPRFTSLVVLTLLIGWLDHATGDELDLFIVYFLPITYAAWSMGLRAGIALSILSGVLWAAVNVHIGHAYTHPLVGLWGEVVFLVTFIASAVAAARIHGLLDRERELNQDLVAAMARIKKLSGRLPICIGCKNVQDDQGRWQQIEEYFTHQSEDDFVFKQCVCPVCRGSRSHGDEFSTERNPDESIRVG